MSRREWPGFWRQLWSLIGPQRRHGVRYCPYLPCCDDDCPMDHSRTVKAKAPPRSERDLWLNP